jgi:ubiquinone/menaquinone biosynthesis C-methylase UbiE
MSISKAYNQWAPTYDSMANKTRDLEERAARETLKYQHFEHIVELGCGTGKNTVWLLDKAERLTALDFSEEMLAIAKQKVNHDNVLFHKTDLTKSWPAQTESADLISCSLVLEHIEDLNHIFNQAYSTLADNGKIYICELHPFKQYNGSKAQFDTGNGKQELDVFTHHTSDYLNAAMKHDFKLLELKEWFDDDNRENIPRLISFVFGK